MLLWTIQDYTAYQDLLINGTLTANEDYIDVDFKRSYDWLAGQMQKRGLILPNEVKYPMWAWYQWKGKRKKRDMRESGYAQRGTKIVRLEIEIDDEDVLLSDFDLWHYVLNNWYLPINEQEDAEFEKQYTDLGVKYGDWQDSSKQSDALMLIRLRIENSWERIFDLSIEDNGWLFGLNSEKSIQATFWQLKIEQVRNADMFIAR